MSPRKKEANQELRDKRRAQILDAALSAYIERGFNGTDMDLVAERAGLAKGLVYYYFKTKLELFRAMFEDAFNASIAANRAMLEANAEKDPVRRLARFMVDVLALAERDPRLLRFAMRLPFDAYAVFAPAQWPTGYAGSQAFMASIAAMVGDIQAAGAMAGGDAGRAAASVWAVFMANALDFSRMIGAMGTAGEAGIEAARRGRIEETLGFCFRLLGVAEEKWKAAIKEAMV